MRSASACLLALIALSYCAICGAASALYQPEVCCFVVCYGAHTFAYIHRFLPMLRLWSGEWSALAIQGLWP